MFTAQDDWLKFPVKCLNAQWETLFWQIIE
jgi:hypothetical protein